MLHPGSKHQDGRGKITYNNEFDVSKIKRIYTIENASTDFIRGWQGHAIEQRWFAAVSGAFEINVIQVDNFDKPSRVLIPTSYQLESDTLTYLHVPAGCITAIRALKQDSKLLALADYALGEVQDEYRFEIDYFKI